jgi:hypothetical protein
MNSEQYRKRIALQETYGFMSFVDLASPSVSGVIYALTYALVSSWRFSLNRNINRD